MAHIVLGHGAWRMPAWPERQRRGRDRLPGILICRERLGAFPGTLRGGFAAGMRQLNAELGAADAPAMGNDARNRILAGVRIKPEAAMRDAAMALDMRRLEDQE